MAAENRSGNGLVCQQVCQKGIVLIKLSPLPIIGQPGEIFSFLGSQSILGRPFVKNNARDCEQDP